MPDLRCTYRVQLSRSFTFADAAQAVPFLRELGVSHLYLSPVLAATPGSTHGYDVCDTDRIDADRGGEDGFRALVQRAGDHGLGIVLDIVPNHMATHHSNRLWFDVLRFGPRSRHAGWFDIEWLHGNETEPQRVLLPVLGDHYGAIIAGDDLALARGERDLLVEYFERAFPLSIPSTARIIASATRQLPDVDDAVAHAVATMFSLGESPAEQVEALRTLEQLAEAWRTTPSLAAAIDAELSRISADRDELHELLEEQHYRLARWTAASEDLDYRRFFDVADLIGLRMEDPEVFERSHRRILQLVGDRLVDGLRIDHPDGLADPTEYARRLRGAAPDAWILVEKILVGDERLPASWPVDGTTGYETAVLIDHLLVDPRGEEALDAAVTDCTGEEMVWEDVRRTAKQLIVEQVLVGEVRRLAAELGAIAASSADRLDVSRASLERAVAAFAVEMPVYRTYVEPGQAADAHDRTIIAATAERVRDVHPDLEPELVELVAATLASPGSDAGRRDERAERFVSRFQQLSGPVMAKGVEDTAFYRYPRLVSLNEVGGEPGELGIDLDTFHRRQAEAAISHPRRMVTVSTHDTKRSADVRARIDTLSEVPERWHETARRLLARLDELVGTDHRDAVVDYLLAQTLFGAGSISVERAQAYAQKAAREAKRATSWLSPDEHYEAQLARVAEHLVTDEVCVRALDGLRAEVDPGATANTLATTLLHLTLPGIPDLYQGGAVPSYDLVDPDNRRPVDLDAQRAMLADPTAAPAKFRLVRTCLDVRTAHPDCFIGPSATYTPLTAEGRAADHVVAYLRGDHVAVVATRFALALARDGGWRGTTLPLPSGSWRRLDRDGPAIAGGDAPLDELLDPSGELGPVAVLERT